MPPHEGWEQRGISQACHIARLTVSKKELQADVQDAWDSLTLHSQLPRAPCQR